MTNDHLTDGTAPIELGSVSGDTRGNAGAEWENGGLKLYPGLSDD